MSIRLLRSSSARKRPNPASLLDGQPALNIELTEPGLFFRTSSGTLVKVGPAAITSNGNPPNHNPQGSAGNSVGELWLDKSHSNPILKIFNGADWDIVGSVDEDGLIISGNVKYSASLAGAEGRTLTQALSDRVSVKDFGAAGDGTADDTNAIRAAVTSGATAIYFPYGTYKVSGRVLVEEGQTLFGEGTIVAASTLTPHSDTWAANQWAFFQGYQISGVSIEGLSFVIDAPSSKPVTGGVRAIFLKDCSNVLIKGCSIQGKGGLVNMVGCSQYEVSDCSLDVNDDWSDGGIESSCDLSDGEDFQISNNRIVANDVCPYPILLTGGSTKKLKNFTVSGNTIRGAAEAAIWVNGHLGVNEDFTIAGNSITGCGKGVVLSDCTHAIVSNNTVSNSNYEAIILDSEDGEGSNSSNYCQVTGNVVRNSNQMRSTSNPQSFAILLKDNSSYNQVSGNTITGNKDRNPISLTDTTSFNIVRDNYYFGGNGGGVNPASSVAGEVNFIQGYNGNYEPDITDLQNVLSVELSRATYNYAQGLYSVYATLVVRVENPLEDSSFKVSLPTDATITHFSQVSGHVSGGQVAGTATITSGSVVGDTSTNRAIVGFTSSLDEYIFMTVSFTYFEQP